MISRHTLLPCNVCSEIIFAPCARLAAGFFAFSLQTRLFLLLSLRAAGLARGAAAFSGKLLALFGA